MMLGLGLGLGFKIPRVQPRLYQLSDYKGIHLNSEIWSYAVTVKMDQNAHHLLQYNGNIIQHCI
jgi:hypothetical protein